MSHDRPGVPQDAKVEPQSMPNDPMGAFFNLRFLQNCQNGVPKSSENIVETFYTHIMFVNMGILNVDIDLKSMYQHV